MSEPRHASTWRALAALAVGLVFGVGLSVAQMTNPEKVENFLDVAGQWDPTLICVLGAAVVVATILYRLVLRAPAPLFDARFHLPEKKRIDTPLVLGAVIFGVGWALAGYCPGPAIASLGFANPEALWIVPAMAAGAFLERWQSRRRGARPAGSHEKPQGQES
jgi:uncharacterized membrane protein YedE/YeeE